MNRITLSQTLRGRMTVVRPGMLDAELKARGVTVASRLAFFDEVTFSEEGTIDLGRGDEIRFRSLGHGTLAESPDTSLRHGTSVLEVDGGAGRYASARGRITSNFLVSPDGEVTDERVVVLFIDEEEG